MVGFSSGKDTGNAGRLALDRLCRQDFPGSRMCRTAEALASIELIYIPTDDTYIAYDPHSGETSDKHEHAWSAVESLTCNEWGAGGPLTFGTWLQILGPEPTEPSGMHFARAACGGAGRVACCR
jgi:hypothetical protein